MTAYGMTKAASLVAATKWAVKLAPEGFTVITLSPGLVDTSDTLVDVPGESSYLLGPTGSCRAKGMLWAMQS